MAHCVDFLGCHPSNLITVEEWQARIQACGALTKLLDRKSKLLGMDAPIKVEPSPLVVPESEEQRARAREALKLWTKFQVNPGRLPGKRPFLMIALERLKEVLSYEPYSGEFTWKDIHRRCKSKSGTTTPDRAGAASRYVPEADSLSSSGALEMCCAGLHQVTRFFSVRWFEIVEWLRILGRGY